jgi:hypothetical protein
VLHDFEPIPDEEIDSLRRLVNNSSEFICHPYLKEGMLVEVTYGPLQGIKGRLIREARCTRLVLNVTLSFSTLSPLRSMPITSRPHHRVSSIFAMQIANSWHSDMTFWPMICTVSRVS